MARHTSSSTAASPSGVREDPGPVSKQAAGASPCGVREDTSPVSKHRRLTYPIAAGSVAASPRHLSVPTSGAAQRQVRPQGQGQVHDSDRLHEQGVCQSGGGRDEGMSLEGPLQGGQHDVMPNLSLNQSGALGQQGGPSSLGLDMKEGRGGQPGGHMSIDDGRRNASGSGGGAGSTCRIAFSQLIGQQQSHMQAQAQALALALAQAQTAALAQAQQLVGTNLVMGSGWQPTVATASTSGACGLGTAGALGMRGALEQHTGQGAQEPPLMSSYPNTILVGPTSQATAAAALRQPEPACGAFVGGSGAGPGYGAAIPNRSHVPGQGMGRGLITSQGSAVGMSQGSSSRGFTVRCQEVVRNHRIVEISVVDAATQTRNVGALSPDGEVRGGGGASLGRGL